MRENFFFISYNMENSTADDPKPATLPSENLEDLVGVALPKSVLKKLGIRYTQQNPTEKQKARNDKLREYALARHAKVREDKARFEREQLEKIAKKVKVVQKIKKATDTFIEDDGDDEKEEDLLEFLEYKKFKANKKKKQEVAQKKEEESEDDGYIQKKTEKATKIIEAVSKLDKAINQLQPTNPYLALMKK